MSFCRFSYERSSGLLTHLGGIWTLALGSSADCRTQPIGPTGLISCLARVMTAKYCGKSSVTTRTVWFGLAMAAAEDALPPAPPAARLLSCEGDEVTEEVGEKESRMSQS